MEKIAGFCKYIKSKSGEQKEKSDLSSLCESRGARTGVGKGSCGENTSIQSAHSDREQLIHLMQQQR